METQTMAPEAPPKSKGPAKPCFRDISFFVPGTPKPAGSKRAFFNKGMKFPVIVDACKASKDWKGDVKHFAHANMIGRTIADNIPLHLTVNFVMPRPGQHFGSKAGVKYLKENAPQYCLKKPDATKLLRCVEDAMTGVVYTDDNIIAIQSVSKEYGDKPGAKITVRAIQ